MRYRQYKFKFYLNASHAIYINGNLGQRHPHTWEISINTLKISDGFIKFDKIENKIEQLMKKYDDKFLNDVEPFDKLNPTLENCCEYFKQEIQKVLKAEGWLLMLIEMSETPTRSYVVNLFEDEVSELVESVDSLTESILNSVKNAEAGS